MTSISNFVCPDLFLGVIYPGLLILVLEDETEKKKSWL